MNTIIINDITVSFAIVIVGRLVLFRSQLSVIKAVYINIIFTQFNNHRT